jgi:hypothetical protein
MNRNVRRAAVKGSPGRRATPHTPHPPPSALHGHDDSVARLLSEAQAIVNAAGPEVLAEVEDERSGRRRRKKKRRRKG